MKRSQKLERRQGFLSLLSMTDNTITPFLKGFYLNLNSRQPAVTIMKIGICLNKRRNRTLLVFDLQSR